MEKIRLLERCDGLIRRKATGKPVQFARKLGISKSSLYDTINLMKEMGAPIEYCNSRQCYIYKYETICYFGFNTDFSGKNFSSP